MEELVLYLKMGLFHVLDFKAYDHILFLAALAVIYKFKQWKKVIWLITFFTIGHSISLALSVYGILKIKAQLIEFLIPATIFTTALFNILTARKSSNEKGNLNLFFAFFFGLIHGLGFSNYFKMMIGKSTNKLLPLIEFALGVEIAQIIIVIGILCIGSIFQTFFGVNRRDWILITSSIIIGFASQMMFDRVFW